MKIENTLWIIFFVLILTCGTGCYKSPTVDFHTYDEFCLYPFFKNGWFPDFITTDAIEMIETYDVNTNHVFGKFDIKNRPLYDSILSSCPPANTDSVFWMISNLKRPECPSWFPSVELLKEKNALLVKRNSYSVISINGNNTLFFIR